MPAPGLSAHAKNRLDPFGPALRARLDFGRDRSRRIGMRLTLSTLVCLLLCGCAARCHETPVCERQPAPTVTANLALGPSNDVLAMAEAFAWRSPGPAYDTGYTLEDSSVFSDIQLDEQYSCGPYGGFSRYATNAHLVTFVR